ncbi:MAG: UDP-glucose/GDP-mannose dehydrogenase family protein, partial [Candidatus Roizmanbacteria bacterium]|nr:UDP-glucose/GDP-mannose dehydrogenase family protein [Candidatus Roizmanbacteria bacterium]
MEKTLKPLIEYGTGKKIGKDIGLCYSPELIALGSVVHNITYPDFLLIGESERKTGDKVKQLRKYICDNDPIIIHTNWINAELIKLSLNAYITTKISFANMIARISERIVGADSDIILNAIGQDSRIGTKYLKGGLGFGGPCFPRDNISLYSTIKKAGLNINLPLNTDIFNKDQINYIY